METKAWNWNAMDRGMVEMRDWIERSSSTMSVFGDRSDAYVEIVLPPLGNRRSIRDDEEESSMRRRKMRNDGYRECRGKGLRWSAGAG